MKENELRLNNLVMVNYKGVDLLSKVTWIQEGSINVVFDRQPDLVNGVVCSVNDLIPIEITAQRLLDSKFYYDEKRDTYKHEDISLEIDLNDNMVCVSESWEWKNVEFAHQLQNLYFALTGNELYKIS